MKTWIRPAGSATRRIRLSVVVASLALFVSGAALTAPLASAAVSTPSGCHDPQVPRDFHKQLVTAIRLSRNLPMAWADSPNIPKIICWQDTSFDTSFVARAPWHRWHGEFAMTVEEMRTIAG
ncbi:MAG TPA: hypothetical protein VFB09_08020, partial [Actinomycetota bacterium]|nr:hypothetical protein [Actinomycetota bacterium]